MQNIDPLYLLIPICVIGFSVGLVIYWHYKRCFTKQVLLYSFIAYFGAIILKYIIQLSTLRTFTAVIGGINNLGALGLYFGFQTVIFEVGGAYLVAKYAAKGNKLFRKDAGAFGLGLALWENVGYFGVLTLLNYVSYYVILSTGTGSLSELVYNSLLKNSPGLFLPPDLALPNIGLSILERVSSLFAHFGWGTLVVLSVVYRKKWILGVALPMGLIDFLAPFAGSLGSVGFELLIFAISLGFLGITFAVARISRKNFRVEEADRSDSTVTVSPKSQGISKSLTYMNFRRALSYGRIYLIIGIAMSILIGSVLVIAIKSVSSSPRAIGTFGISGVAGSILPLFALIGSMGALMVFVSDKDKGVYEYLISYGVDVSRIFWSIVISTVGLAAIILTVSISSMTTVMFLTGVPLTAAFFELIIFYTIPVGFTTTMLGSMVGMIWSSLATRRVGVNSPVGIAPYFGLAPVLAILILSSRTPSGLFIPLVGSVSLLLFIIVVIMIGVSTKKMVRERFLSSA